LNHTTGNQFEKYGNFWTLSQTLSENYGLFFKKKIISIDKTLLMLRDVFESWEYRCLKKYIDSHNCEPVK